MVQLKSKDLCDDYGIKKDPGMAWLDWGKGASLSIGSWVACLLQTCCRPEIAQMLNAPRRRVTPAHLTGPYLPQPRHPIFLCPSPHRALTPLGFCTLRAFWGHDA